METIALIFTAHDLIFVDRYLVQGATTLLINFILVYNVRGEVLLVASEETNENNIHKIK